MRCLLVGLLLVGIVSAQNPATQSVSALILQDGTPVRLRLARNVSSADSKTGDTVDFEVLEEVRVRDILLIPKGRIAWGTVTEAEHKKRMARGGKLDMTIDSVRLVDGEKAALRAVKEAKGGGHTGGMTAGIVATGLIVWPAAPFFLFMHGKTLPFRKELKSQLISTAIFLWTRTNCIRQFRLLQSSPPRHKPPCRFHRLRLVQMSK